MYTPKCVLIFISFLFFITSYSQIPATITSSGTWSSTTGSGPISFAAGSCYSVTVTAWGGGGGGGGATNQGASGGGTGGGYAQGVVSVSGGSTCYYSVGAGGTAGTTSGSNGGNGGPTWFNGTAGTNNNTTGSFINASGGTGGNGATTQTGAAAQTTVGTGTFGASGVTATVSYSGGTGGGGFVNGNGDGGGGGGGGGAGSGGNGGNGATTTTGGTGAFGCANGGGAGGGGGGGATGPGANGNPGNSNGGGGTGGAANGGGAGGSGSGSAAGVLGTGTPGGAGVAFGGGGGAGNGCCGCNGGAGGDGAPGSGSIGGGGGGGTGDGGGGNGGNGGAHGGGGAGADGGSSASGGTGGVGYITITVATIPVPTATAGPALSAICAGSTSAIMGGSVSAGATALWTGGTGTWTNATDPANATYTPGAAETGTITLTLTATNACGINTATKTITINPAPAAPTVTNPVTYCQNATATALTATAVGSPLWYTVPTGGVGSATAPTPSTVATGSTTYYVTQTQAGCESPRALITVTVNALPTAGASNTGPYCGTTVTITVSATGGTTYNWSGPNAYSGTGASPAPFSTATYGAGIYTVTVTNASNCSAVTTTNVVINNTAAPTATSPVIYCQNVMAAPLTATGAGTLLWYAVATGGVGSATAPTPSTASSGSTVYYVSQTQNSCESARTPITVTINPTPAAPTVTSPVNYCQNATATALTAAGAGSLLWYTAATGGTGSSAAPTPSTAASGSTTYYVSQTQTGCESSRTALVVTVLPSPTPSASNTGPYCTDGIIVLSATGGNSYSWSCTNGYTGTGASPSSFSATLYGAGTFTYSVTVTAANACTASAGTNVVVNASTIPTAVTATANLTTLCPGTTLMLSGSATGATHWNWTGPGGFTFNQQNPIIAAPVTGTYTLTASNTCGAAANTGSVSITIDNPTASISGTLSYCNGSNTTLTANPSGATSYAWSNGNSTISTSAIVSGNPYQVTVTDANGCSASASATVSVDNPTASISGALGFCPGGSTTLTSNAGTAYLWSDAANSTTQSITVSTAGPYSVTVTDASGCTATTTATVAVSPVPTTPTVTSPVIYCQNATANPLTATAAGTLLWYTVATGGTGNTTSPTPSTADSGSTTYYVSQIQTGCEGPRDSIVVIINPTPIAAANNTGPYCVSGNITLSASGGATYSWSGPNGYTAAVASPTPFSAAASGAGTYMVTVTSPASCAATAITNVVVNSPTTSAISQTICSGQSFTFNRQSISTAGTYYDTLTNAAGCDSIIGLTLTVLPMPIAAFSIHPIDDSIQLGTSIALANTSLNTDSVQWLLNDQAISLLSGSTLPVSDTGLYCISLSASNAVGCSNISSPQCIRVFTYGPQSFYMPNAFTPNGDGINDFLEVYGKKELVIYLSIQIFDRWGEKVFESNDSGFSWDGTYKGKAQSDGVYVYVLDITLLTGQSISKRGSLTVIR